MKPRRHKKPPAGIFTTQIERLSHEGRGIALIDGKTTFIDNALPEEIVEFEYTFTKSAFAEGRAITIKNPSVSRVTPTCPHFSICGGCSMQHMSHESQLDHKQHALIEKLAHFGQTSPKELLSPISGPEYGYRTKARLGVRFVEKKGVVLVGFREKYSNYLALIDHCPVLDPKMSNLIMPLRNMIGTLDAKREIAQIEVAVGENDVILIFRHLKPLSEHDQSILIDFGKTHSIEIYVQSGGPDTVKPLIEGKDLYLTYQTDDNLTFLFHPTDFTQVNYAVNRQMLKLAVALLELKASDQVLDLFCGLGNFTLNIAKKVNQVTGIEGSQEMVDRAIMNAQHNHIDHARFYPFDLTQDFSEQAWSKQTYNKMLIDPPRSGADLFIEKFDFTSIERLVYVSCNPATLARDTALLIAKGFHLAKAGILDMFPQTSHVESIALFIKTGQ